MSEQRVAEARGTKVPNYQWDLLGALGLNPPGEALLDDPGATLFEVMAWINKALTSQEKSATWASGDLWKGWQRYHPWESAAELLRNPPEDSLETPADPQQELAHTATCMWQAVYVVWQLARRLYFTAMLEDSRDLSLALRLALRDGLRTVLDGLEVLCVNFFLAIRKGRNGPLIKWMAAPFPRRSALCTME